MNANIGDWVQVTNILLNPDQRAPQVPDDTKMVPLQMWVKGYITHPAKIGELAEIRTVTGRIIKGTLTEINPAFNHDFGNYVPELGKIRDQVKSMLFEEADK